MASVSAGNVSDDEELYLSDLDLDEEARNDEAGRAPFSYDPNERICNRTNVSVTNTNSSFVRQSAHNYKFAQSGANVCIFFRLQNDIIEAYDVSKLSPGHPSRGDGWACSFS